MGTYSVATVKHPWCPVPRLWFVFFVYQGQLCLSTVGGKTFESSRGSLVQLLSVAAYCLYGLHSPASASRLQIEQIE